MKETYFWEPEYGGVVFVYKVFWTFKNTAEKDSNSASSSSEDQQQYEESGIDELEVRIRSALPYQDEPVAPVAAHTDEDKMDSHDEDDEKAFLRQLWRPDLRSCFCWYLVSL